MIASHARRAGLSLLVSMALAVLPAPAQVVTSTWNDKSDGHRSWTVCRAAA